MINQNGQTLVETLVILIIIGLGTATAAPVLGSYHRRAALRNVTERVRSHLWQIRSDAIRTGRCTALVFDRTDGGRWRCRIVQDGDGDGVLRADLEAGVDPEIGRIPELETDRAGLGLLRGERIPDPSGEGFLGGDPDDPIRAGSGDIVTFTPEGTATPATLYFSDGCDGMRAIRIFGATGRLRTLGWQIGWNRWRLMGL